MEKNWPQCFSERRRPAAMIETSATDRSRGRACRDLVTELEVTSNLETDELGSDERAEHCDAVHRDHGNSKDFNHGYIHLDKNIQET
jgi:hypothetical protein